MPIPTFKHILTLLAINISLCISIFGQSKDESATIRIVPSSCQAEVGAADLFEEINYVPLETTKQSIFGAIQQLIVTKDHFILSDRETNCIFVFFKNGKFCAKIMRQPTERQIFWVDQNKQQIIFIVGMNGFRYYNYKGVMLKKENRNKLEFSEDSHFLRDGVTAYAAYAVSQKFFKDTVNHQVLLARNDKVYASFLPYNMKNSALSSENLPNQEQGPFFSSGDPGWVYYSRPYDYKIYEITPNGFSEKYSFVFPSENTFSTTNFADPSFKRNSRQYFRSKPDLISRISHVYQLGSCLSFKLTTAGNQFGPMVYNLQSQTLVSFLNITPDAKSYWMPVNDSKTVSGFSDQGIISCDGDYFYASLSSAALISQRKLIIDKSAAFPKALSTFFEKANMMNNPIILQIKPKQNF